MKKAKTMGIGTKLVLQVNTIISVVLAISFVIIIMVASNSNEKSATAQVTALAGLDAGIIKEELESTLDTATTMAQIMGSYQDLDATQRRSTYNSFMKELLANNPTFLGIWTCWEPNALDNMDAQLVNTSGADASGRFVPYWQRVGDELRLTPVVDYEKPGAGDFYLLARNSGKTTILEPYTYQVDGKAVLMTTISIPIKASNGTVVGVVGIDISMENLQRIQFDKGSYASAYTYVLSNSGTCVYHANQSILGENVKEVDKNEKMDEILQAVKQGQAYSYFSKSATNGETVRRTMAPVKIGDTETPWSVCVSVAENEIMANTKQMSMLLIGILVALLAVIVIFLIFIIRTTITNRIKKVTAAAQEIADGNFAVQLSVDSGDELGQLAQAFKLTIDRLVNYQGYIDEIADALFHVSEGDLTVVLHRDYVGQFKKLKDNMQALLINLNNTLSQINQSSDQVSSGADQVACGAQALSQGTTEQASSIEELSASFAEVTQQSRQNANNAKLANSKAELAGQEIFEGNKQMKNMVEAMHKINSKSSEISKIIKVIEDIAFQTNILALNAAVEAARAGVAGKGFAVVADEVRNLASKSADAAKGTTALIEETLIAVQDGTQIVHDTALSLEESEKVTREAVLLIDRITDASERQAEAANEINLGVEQIASVVQTNSATAEESAAASEELNAQADLLKSLISRFKLANHNHNFDTDL